MRTKLR
jgi:hypothetical protein